MRTLNAYEWGERGAPVIVCLHGVSSYGGRFDGLAEPLADRYHVIGLDLLGHGHSPSEPPWDVDAHLDAIVASIPDAPAIWIGHSFGGRLVAELAARDPGRVERVALLDPALHVLPHVAFDMAELERVDASYATVEDAVNTRYDSGRVLLAPRELVIESDRRHMEPGPDGRLRYRYCKSTVIAAWSVMASEPPPPAAVPTLFVIGTDSWLTVPKEIDKYQATLGDLVRVVTVPGGHTVYWDAPEETRAAIEAFLA